MSTSITGLTRGPAGGEGPLHREGRTPNAPRGRLLTSLAHRGRLYGVLALMLLPALAGLALFTYYPQWGAIKFSLYEWDGRDQVDYVGLDNFRRAFGDPLFWSSFQLVLVLLAANVVKMWPSILTAIVLHRLRSERWQYAYRVLFVLPMIIPGVVWLLLWKNLFFDAGTGVLNRFLNATGLMRALDGLDHAMAGVAASAPATLVRDRFVIAGLHGLWWMVLLGVALLLARMALGGRYRGRAFPAGWLLNAAAAGLIALAVGLALLFCTWPAEPMRVFAYGTPPWLGHEHLIVPSVIFWGFPWVGTVGVLIYLAGLQNISADVYEAAELDGVGSVRRLFAIELPLILTQVRINLIFLTIGTITDYGFFLLLLGQDGGPGAKGMVPGLYMYKSAFVEQKYGYACALGLILFVILLLITVLYQKFVKVDK